ncbi:MAG: hypothetical protein Q7T82_06750 [Armatimonadota bacterium]|nr:hypothetical protein [Armatimonadota bacterium]
MRILAWICVVCLAFALAIGATAETMAAAKPAEVKITVNANGAKVTEVLQSIARQGREKVIVESVVKGEVTLSLKDKSFEDALSTVCKSNKLDWRKVYVGKDAKLIEQPDRFAATVRLTTAMTYPDMVVSGSSTGKIGLFAKDQKAVGKFDDKMASDLGLTRVYLVTDDAKMAAKLAEKKADDSINDYLKKSKEQMEAFMKMTPEQQEQAMMEGLNAADQYPADYSAMAIRAMMSLDPELMRQRMAKQSQAAFDAMFGMPREQRRAFFRMQMQMSTSAMSSMTPEQQQMLQDDIKAIQAEMGGGS